ncbi:hypothetical protein BK008_01355 [Methanobacterium sp. MZ-A1]|uniref:Uncharacterized protein n=1 Tax=Methanobacterium subterraneum TaxID=59277 RepID=A0A2H4VQ68_9EURY|nr:hypothetical protein BK008_01355 [Methanobacterium sp. MZ-A1]AUB60239.1 hypothetical protein BK009_05810 [Methanobacterium subterraneum]
MKVQQPKNIYLIKRPYFMKKGLLKPLIESSILPLIKGTSIRKFIYFDIILHCAMPIILSTMKIQCLTLE